MSAENQPIQNTIEALGNFVAAGESRRAYLQNRIDILQRLPDLFAERYENMRPALFRDIKANAQALGRRDKQTEVAESLLSSKLQSLDQEEDIVNKSQEFISQFKQFDEEYEKFIKAYQSNSVDPYKLQGKVSEFWYRYDMVDQSFAKHLEEWVLTSPIIAERIIVSGLLSQEQVEEIYANYADQTSGKNENEANSDSSIESDEVDFTATKRNVRRTKDVKSRMVDMFLTADEHAEISVDDFIQTFYPEEVGLTDRFILARRISVEMAYAKKELTKMGYVVKNVHKTKHGEGYGQGRYRLESLNSDSQTESDDVELDYEEKLGIYVLIRSGLKRNELGVLDQNNYSGFSAHELMFIGYRLSAAEISNTYTQLFAKVRGVNMFMDPEVLSQLRDLVQFDNYFLPENLVGINRTELIKQYTRLIIDKIDNFVDVPEKSALKSTGNEAVDNFMQYMFDAKQVKFEYDGNLIDGIDVLRKIIENNSTVISDLQFFKSIS